MDSMDKPQIHRSVIIAWNLANQEAWRSGFSTIEPIHFLIGILLFCDGLYGNDTTCSDISPESSTEFRNITSKCLVKLNLEEEEVTKIRRKLQSSMHLSDSMPYGLLHRGSSTKKLFNRAEEFAQQVGNKFLSLDHLTEAIMGFLPFKVRELPPNLNSFLATSGNVDSSELKIALEMRMMGQQGTIDQIVQIYEEILKEPSSHETTNKICVFYGPPGSGKLIASEVIAESLFPRRSQLLRIDLSVFTDDKDVGELVKILATFIHSQNDSVYSDLGNNKVKGIILFRNFEYSSPLVKELISSIFESSQMEDEKKEKVEITNYLIILNINNPDDATNLFAKYEAIKFCHYFIKFAKTDLDSFIEYFSELFTSFYQEIKEKGVIVEFDDTSRINAIIWLSELARDKYGFSYLFDREIAKPIKQVIFEKKNLPNIRLVWSPKGIVIQF